MMMQFTSPGPIITEFGPLTIRWYGLLTAIAFLVSLFSLQKLLEYKQKTLGDEYALCKFDHDALSNYAISLLIGALIGARLWFVFLNLNYFILNPTEIPQIWLGGQSIQGGIIGAVITTFIFYPKHATELLALVASVVPLGQAIGRWGNFFNEEAFGSVTDLPWKLYISHTGAYHHPTFLYESIWNLLVFATMIFINTKISRQPRKIIGSYLILYSFGRLIIETIRVDSLLLIGLPAASLIAIFSIILGLLLILKNEKQR